jgi:glycosyltransferase involved in cell wall biosynthesis
MNILQVTLGFYPAQGWGGPVKVVHQNGRELVRRGHNVTVYCSNLVNKYEKIQPGTFEREMDGMRIVYFDTWNIKQWPGTLGPIWLPDLPAYIKREIRHFDVAHINGYRSPMILPIVTAARQAGVPIVTQPHGAMPIIVNSQTVKRLYDKVFGQMELEGISALIALQESERQQAQAHNIPAERIVILPNGIDPVDMEQAPPPGSFRRRLGLSPDAPVILFLGRINKKKGADMLVEAFAQMNNHAAQLVIAGPDDGQLTKVQELIQQHGLEGRVFLPGLVSGPDVLAAFRDADLFVLPCRADTFPVVIMEACLAGTPMVITDRCEIAHLVKDKVSEVVPFDAGLFAQAMDNLLADREKYSQYKANCAEMIADTFSIQAVVDQLETIYQRAIEEKNHL